MPTAVKKRSLICPEYLRWVNVIYLCTYNNNQSWTLIWDLRVPLENSGKLDRCFLRISLLMMEVVKALRYILIVNFILQQEERKGILMAGQLRADGGSHTRL